MGNIASGNTGGLDPDGTTTNSHYKSSTPRRHHENNNNDLDDDTMKSKYRSFPGSAMLEKTFCGSIDTTDPSEYDNVSTMNRILKRAEILCVSSPLASSSSVSSDHHRKKSNRGDAFDEDENSILDSTKNSSTTKTKSRKTTSKLLARALVSEVTDNPKTMTQAAMTDRERKLLKAAAAAASPDKKTQNKHNDHYFGNGGSSQYHAFSSSSPVQHRKPVGVAAPPHFVRSVAYACTGDDDTVTDLCNTPHQELSFYQSAANTNVDAAVCGAPGSKTISDEMDDVWADHPNVVTIGIALSRHANNYSRNGNSQPVYGHPSTVSRQTQYDFNDLQDRQYKYVSSVGPEGWRAGGGEIGEGKLPDEAHIPIIRIHCPTEASVDAVITALASGEIFIPQVQILPEQLTVHNCLSTGSTNLVVNFGCERNDDIPVEEWPNWCLEFLHNQLYEYFASSNGSGAIWMKRSFTTTLAKQVRWKTVKHMNRYFASAEKVIAAWRDIGPQSLTPTPSHLEGGASADEVARPHGIYLYRGGVPTNYFCPNFEPPYTTKMTRSLLMTVLQKSWDKKRREWSSKPVPRVVEPSALLAAACGYASDLDASGYMAHKATTVSQPPSSTSVKKQIHHQKAQSSTFSAKEPLSVVEFGRTFSEDISLKENNRKNGNDDASKKSASYKNNPPSTNARPELAGSYGAHVSMDDTDNNVSVAPSALNASIAESGTTVLHANSRKPPVAANTKTIPNTTPKNSHHKVLDVSTNARRLYSDEDFLDELSSVDTPPGLSAVTSPRGAAIAAEEQRRIQQQRLQPPDTSSNSNDESTMQQQLSVVRQSAMESPTSSPTKRAQVKLDREKRAQLEQQNGYSASYVIPARTMTGNNIVNKVVGVEPSSSLEYSTDGSSAFFLDNSTTTTAQQPSKVNLLEPLQSSHSADDDDESALLSIQESSSSIVSDIPTDEELFSVGWAKALDEGSGNYYYFTLDRTRTVWENPLSASQWGGELPPPVHQNTNGNNLNQNQQTSRTTAIHRPIDP